LVNPRSQDGVKPDVCASEACRTNKVVIIVRFDPTNHIHNAYIQFLQKKEKNNSFQQYDKIQYGIMSIPNKYSFFCHLLKVLSVTTLGPGGLGTMMS
jgi:hypothetical protein